MNFSRGPLHFSHSTGEINLLLLPHLYLLGGTGSLPYPPTPLLPPLCPPPFLSSPLLLLLPHGAVTWHCSLPSSQPKCTGFWTVPVVLPPNQPTSPSPATASASKSSFPLPTPPSPPPGFPVPSLSLPPPGPGVPHPLPLELPPGIHTGKMNGIMNNPSISTCSELYCCIYFMLFVV